MMDSTPNAYNIHALIAQYPPISKADQEVLLRLKCTGDEEARTLLIMHNLAFVLFVLNKKFWYSYRMNSDIALKEELESAGVIGLIEAVDRYDVTKSNVTLGTYAYWRIFNAIWDTIILDKTGNVIPVHAYQVISKFIKNNPNCTEKQITEFIQLYWNMNDFMASTVNMLVRYGLASTNMHVHSGGLEREVNMEDVHVLMNDQLGTVIHSDFAENSKTESTYARVELVKIAGDFEKYCQTHLTKNQYKVLADTVIPFLRSQPHKTIREVAVERKNTYQAVDQLFDSMEIRMSKHQRGPFMAKVMRAALSMIQNGQREPRVAFAQ